MSRRNLKIVLNPTKKFPKILKKCVWVLTTPAPPSLPLVPSVQNTSYNPLSAPSIPRSSHYTASQPYSYPETLAKPLFQPIQYFLTPLKLPLHLHSSTIHPLQLPLYLHSSPTHTPQLPLHLQL